MADAAARKSARAARSGARAARRRRVSFAPRAMGLFVLGVAVLAFAAGAASGEIGLVLAGAVFSTIWAYCLLMTLLLALLHSRRARRASIQVSPSEVAAGAFAEALYSEGDFAAPGAPLAAPLAALPAVRVFQAPGILVRCRLILATKDGRQIQRDFSPAKPGPHPFEVKKRGAYFSAFDEFAVFDALGFFRLAFRLRSDSGGAGGVGAGARLLAKPRPAGEAPAVHARAGDSSQRPDFSLQRSDILIDHRPYVPGDDPRRINWKLYGHGGNLIVREGEREPPPHANLTILIDAEYDPALYTQPEARRGIDLLCENALAAAIACAESGMHVLVGSLGGVGGAGNAGGSASGTGNAGGGADYEASVISAISKAGASGATGAILAADAASADGAGSAADEAGADGAGRMGSADGAIPPSPEFAAALAWPAARAMRNMDGAAYAGGAARARGADGHAAQGGKAGQGEKARLDGKAEPASDAPGAQALPADRGILVFALPRSRTETTLDGFLKKAAGFQGAGAKARIVDLVFVCHHGKSGAGGDGIDADGPGVDGVSADGASDASAGGTSAGGANAGIANDRGASAGGANSGAIPIASSAYLKISGAAESAAAESAVAAKGLTQRERERFAAAELCVSLLGQRAGVKARVLRY